MFRGKSIIAEHTPPVNLIVNKNGTSKPLLNMFKTIVN